MKADKWKTEPQSHRVEDVFGVTQEEVQAIGKEFQEIISRSKSAGIIARDFGILVPDKPTRLKMVRAFLFGRFAESTSAMTNSDSRSEIAQKMSNILTKISNRAIQRGDKRVVLDIVDVLMEEGVDDGLAGSSRAKKRD